MPVVIELTAGRFHDLVKPATGWPYEAIHALYKYLDDLSDELGDLIDIDPVALRCEWAYYPSEQACKAAYNLPDDKDLEDYTTVIRFDGGVLVQNF